MTLALTALIVTILVETGLALVLQHVRLVEVPGGRLRVDVPLINLLTHPIASLVARNSLVPFALIELAVVVVELIAYRAVTRLSWTEAAILALTTNGATILLSLVVGYGIG